METFKVSGKFKESQIIREVKEGTFARNFVVIVADEGPYPKQMPILFNIVGKMPRMALIDHFADGDEVEVEFELRGRVSLQDSSRYYNNLHARYINKL